MTRAELEDFILMANFDIGDPLIWGTVAVLGQFPNPPPEIARFIEEELFPDGNPPLPLPTLERLALDAEIREMSGALDPEAEKRESDAAKESLVNLPAGWDERLIAVKSERTCGVTGWCVEVHDLAVSKLAAGGEKELRFVSLLARAKMIAGQTLMERIAALRLPEQERELVRQRWQTLSQIRE